MVTVIGGSGFVGSKLISELKSVNCFNLDKKFNQINKGITIIGDIRNRDEISINVDATKVLFPDPNLSINIYFGSKRILLPLRLRYMYNTLE